MSRSNNEESLKKGSSLFMRAGGIEDFFGERGGGFEKFFSYFPVKL